MNPAMRPVAAILLLAIVLMLASFVWASLEMSLAAGLAAVASTRWGVVTLADLGAGLVVVSAWIALLERSAVRAVPWIIAMILLGNFTMLVYLLWRCRRATSLHDLLLRPTRELPLRRGGPARSSARST
jgi:hypothetical protein